MFRRNLRKQWHQELQDKFNLQSLILEAKNYNTIRKQENQNPFLMPSGPVICSYQFAKAKAADIKDINWDLVVLDEGQAHTFMSTRATDAQTDDDVVMDTIRELLKHMDDKTRSMILITAWALRETQGLQAHKLDLPSLRRALMLNIGNN